MKILIADDDARMREMLKQIVSSCASEVYEAGDGREAVAICNARQPDCVLMDRRMKPLDGLRATMEIKARFPGMRIIMVTQYDDEELRAEAVRAGICAYVLKEDLQELPRILAGETPGSMTGKQKGN